MCLMLSGVVGSARHLTELSTETATYNLWSFVVTRSVNIIRLSKYSTSSCCCESSASVTVRRFAIAWIQPSPAIMSK